MKSGDIKAYYNSHKNMFKQTPSRTLSYVVFEVSPTDDDMLALEKSVAEVGAQFAATEELKSFVRANRNGKIADNYVSAAQLSEEEAKALLAGETYGPVLKNNEWTMARALDSKMVPDSMGIRHIVLPYTQEALADSLLTVLKGGADFAQARLRSIRFTTLRPPTAAKWAWCPSRPSRANSLPRWPMPRPGDIVKIASGDAIQLMQVYRADKPSKHVQVATITYPVEASAATRRDMPQPGRHFLGERQGFGRGVQQTPLRQLPLRLASRSLAQGERTIRGLEDSREVARWAYGAEAGDLSEIFTVGKDYVIATLTEIDDNEYRPARTRFRRRSVPRFSATRNTIISSSRLSGSTLDEQAASLGSEVADFDDVTFGAFYVNGPGVEPRLVGAIASTTEKGVLSAPVKGMSGRLCFPGG